MDIELDISTGDIKVTDGQLTFVTGLDAIAQHLRLRLSLFRGEWFLDQRIGIPYFEDVLVKNPNLALLNTIFRNAILSTPGVISITEFSLELSSARVATIEFTALTTEGVLEYDQELIL